MKIAFIGAGNMGSAIVGGLAANGHAGADVMVCDPNADKRERLASAYGVRTFESVGEWLGQADVLVLAVKPQGLESCVASLRDFIREDTLIISIAAGITIASLRKWFGRGNIVRVMPNTPAKVGRGLSGMYADADVSEASRQTAQAIMECVGRAVWLESEDKIHLVVAGPGSGPAYVFLFMESLCAALQAQGLSADEAREFALSTVEGAAALARQSGDDFAYLRECVTSKGGTTAAALNVFEQRQTRQIMQDAVQACIARSVEMGKLFG